MGYMCFVYTNLKKMSGEDSWDDSDRRRLKGIGTNGAPFSFLQRMGPTVWPTVPKILE